MNRYQVPGANDAGIERNENGYTRDSPESDLSNHVEKLPIVPNIKRILPDKSLVLLCSLGDT